MFDKWDLKPLSFKQDFGKLSGKSGWRTERAFLKHCIENGKPSILHDLTNCLRYGDISFVQDGSIHIAEIKSSANMNARTERQRSNAAKMINYLSADKAGNFLSIRHIQRSSPPTEECHYRDELNRLIAETYKRGYAISEVEPGLRYGVFSKAPGPEWDHLLEGYSRPLVFFVNEAKCNSSWIHHYPPVLSIRDITAFVDFISGDLCVFVVANMNRIHEFAG
jgi:hypothetical protein